MSGSHPIGFCPSPFSSLLLALSTPGQGAAGAGWSWGPQGFSRRIVGILKGAWTCSRRQPGGSGRTWGGSESHWVCKHCVPSGNRVSLGHSHLCSSEPSDEGQQLLSPHPDLDHGAASSHPPFPGSQPYCHILPIRLGIWNHCQSSHSGHSWSVAKPRGSGGSFGHASMEQERGRQQGKDGAGLWPTILMTSPLVQSPAARDESREDKTTIKCETSPPSSPRTLRLEKLGHPALSQEDGKRYVDTLGVSVWGYTWGPHGMGGLGFAMARALLKNNLKALLLLSLLHPQLTGGPGQQSQQQPGLLAQGLQEEGDQILHRAPVWEEREGSLDPAEQRRGHGAGSVSSPVPVCARLSIPLAPPEGFCGGRDTPAGLGMLGPWQLQGSWSLVFSPLGLSGLSMVSP